MKVNSTALGEIEVAEGQIFEMPSGMIGFPRLRRFALIPFPDKETPFSWWQCLDEPALCFILIDPAAVFPEYRIDVSAGELEEIQLSNAAEAAVFVVVTIPENPRDMTANLMGPLVLNRTTRKAKQLVLMDASYTTKHRLIPAEACGHACAHSETE